MARLLEVLRADPRNLHYTTLISSVIVKITVLFQNGADKFGGIFGKGAGFNKCCRDRIPSPSVPSYTLVK